jgi:hypothetical protein
MLVLASLRPLQRRESQSQSKEQLRRRRLASQRQQQQQQKRAACPAEQGCPMGAERQPQFHARMMLVQLQKHALEWVQVLCWPEAA